MSDLKMVIVMRTDLGMNVGKMCAQAAHAASLFLMNELQVGGDELSDDQKLWLFGPIYDEPDENGWTYGDMRKIVVSAPNEATITALMEKADDAGIVAHSVIDKTLGVVTCCAIGPDNKHEIDKIAGHLKSLSSAKPAK